MGTPERGQGARDHGEATEFVRRLYASPGATTDNEWIHRGMYRRYQARFGEELRKCPPPTLRMDNKNKVKL